MDGPSLPNPRSAASFASDGPSRSAGESKLAPMNESFSTRYSSVSQVRSLR